MAMTLGTGTLYRTSGLGAKGGIVVLMIESEARDILKSVGAILTDDHFVYTSGKHGSAYLNKDALYSHTRETSRLCGAFALAFIDKNIEVVVAPAIGGIILSQWTAYHLSQQQAYDVAAVYVEKDAQGSPTLIKRGYEELIPGKRVLVLEDTVNTGGSVKAVIESVRKLGGTVVGVGLLCNRTGVKARDFDVPKLHSLVNLPMDVWEASECPLCKEGVPVNIKIGKGKDFVNKKK